MAWAHHLRSGGTTPWAAFQPTPPSTAPQVSGEVPGAAQLELVRRLAERWHGPGFERLADSVLRREAPGRGLPRLPVAHPDAPRDGGAPPVDPSVVPVEELLRLGAGVLADLAVALSPRRRPQPRRRPRVSRRPVLLGAAVTRYGYPGRHRGVVVVAPTLDQLLTEAWSARAQLGSGVRWRRFVELWAGRDLLPLSADPARLAAEAAQRAGTERVRVLVGSAGRLPEPKITPAGEPVSLSAESVDLLRRVNPLLAVRLADEERERARATAVRLLEGGAFRPLPIPPRHRAWARSRAERIADQLSARGYAVEGDLDEFVAGLRGRPMYREDVLDRLVDVIVRAVRDGGGTAELSPPGRDEELG